MQQEPRLNRIEPLPGAASGYRILLSENAGRLASRSVLGPTLMTPLFAVQAVRADLPRGWCDEEARAPADLQAPSAS